MHRLNLKYRNSNKVRGGKRQIAKMIQDTNALLNTFPKENSKGYWKMYLPVSEMFIASNKTPHYIKKAAIQTLIDAATHLVNIKPLSEKARVIVSLELPNIWFSQINVYFNEEYYNNKFFNKKNGKNQEQIEGKTDMSTDSKEQR